MNMMFLALVSNIPLLQAKLLQEEGMTINQVSVVLIVNMDFYVQGVQSSKPGDG